MNITPPKINSSQPKKAEEAFSVFKKQYSEILEKFLSDKSTATADFNIGQTLGQQAVANQIGILTAAAIHHACLTEYLEKLETSEHDIIFEKATFFFEAILSAFQTLQIDFRETTSLLNQQSRELVSRVRALKKSLKEKEALLKEVHHRVNNNLQVVSSLLNLQAEATQESVTQQALIKSAARIKTMSLLHEELYECENIASVSMKYYINNLFKYLFEIYNIEPDKIRVMLEVDDLALNIDMALPLGLIVTELISNKLKHAFPKNKAGEIHFSFKKNKESLILQIGDNGENFPPTLDIKNVPSMGIQLINMLTEQLGGEISIDRAKNHRFILTIPYQQK